jgi:peptide chain release factor 3
LGKKVNGGETAVDEKLLLFGGAIQLAGEVKARGERCACGRIGWRSGASAASSAATRSEREGFAFNPLDTPGRQDFSERYGSPAIVPCFSVRRVLTPRHFRR